MPIKTRTDMLATVSDTRRHQGAGADLRELNVLPASWK
jgi:hypothetical protein